MILAQLNPNIDLSIVVLCYKAGEDVYSFVERLKAVLETLDINWELILVGNYNKGDLSDSTPRVVKDIASKDERIVGLAQEKQGMMGWDARCGLDAASGKVIGFTDGDNQFPSEDVARVYRELIEKDLDMAQTYRKTRGDGVFRAIQSQGFNILFAMFFPGMGLKDVNSKPKLFSRSLFDKMELTSDDWFIDAEMAIQARRYKARVGDIPTVFLQLEERKSFTRLSTVFEFVLNLAKARFAEFFRM